MVTQKLKRALRRTIAVAMAFATALAGSNVSALAQNREGGIATYASSSGYQPLTVASGYNVDIVATSSSSSSSEYYTKTEAMDGSGLIGSTGYACLYTSGACGTTGYIPNNGQISSTTTSGLYWQMGSYTSKNALKIYGSGSGTLTFSTVGCYKKIYFLCTAGGITGSSSTMYTTINYSDGTTGTSSFSVYDWYTSTSAATAVYRRLVNGSADGSISGGPYFTQCAMTVDTTKLIKSITVKNTNSSAALCVFGITGEVSDIASPTVSLSGASSNGFNVNWSSVSGAKSYRLDVAKDSNFTNMVTGYNNATVTGTSTTVTGLDAGTTYYVRMRAVDSAGAQGSSSSVVSTKTKANQTVSYHSNGGSGTMSNTICPYGVETALTANKFTKSGYIFSGWNTSADGKGTPYTDQQKITFAGSTNTTLDLYAQWTAVGPVTLLNEGYAYGKKMSESKVTLVTDVKETDSVGFYQWQYAAAKDGDWKDLTNKIESEQHTNEYTFTPTDGYWYRCVVNGVTITTPIQLVKANGAVMRNVTRPYSYGQWYVSNEHVAYTSTVGNGRNFDVLGRYYKQGTYYWLQTSYYGGWQMYTSTSENPTAASYYSGSAQLDRLRVAFDADDTYNMKFDAGLASTERAFAFGCDTMLGNWQTSGSYSDYASLKSIKEEADVKQIQMVGAYSVDTAKATDTSFVLKYVNGYAPSYYWLGRYSQRKVWTNESSLEDVISTDSGMTSSWCNLDAGGNVKFEFHVGAVADTGAKITVCAVSTTTSITIKSPNSSYEYALIGEDGTVESEWQHLSGNEYVYDHLDPNKKYTIKVRKNGEESRSDIYTAIDTNTGADGEEVAWTASTTQLKFSNLVNGYEYALEDANGNRVKGYVTPQDHTITWDGLKAGTDYYLVARDGENDLSEKVKAKTNHAVISFDANTTDTVSGMPEAKTKTYGTPLSLGNTIPVRSGYQFAGWTTAAYKDQKVVWYRANSYYYAESGTTLYAVWYANGETIPTDTYSVSFNSNTADTVSGMPTSGTKQWGDPYALPETTPTRAEYTFREWNEKADGTGQSYALGAAYLDNKAVTLYAIWEIKSYRIVVSENDRYTVTGDITTVNSGEDAVLKFRAKDSFDISNIQVESNGTALDGEWNEDHTEYTVTIPSVKADQYVTVTGVYQTYMSVSEESYDFGSIMENYTTAPEGKNFTLKNDGETSLKIKSIQAGEQSVFEIGGVSTEEVPSGAETTFTVQPKLGVTPGVYKEDIVITTTTGLTKTVRVTFEVEKEPDVIAPNGVITVGEHQWENYRGPITFDTYFSTKKEVMIQAEDDDSGVKSVQYYLSSEVIDQDTLEEKYNVSDNNWKEYEQPFTLQPDGNYIVYVRLEDQEGNVSYISSDGLVFDGTAPEIAGVTNQQEVYLENVYKVSVADAHLDKVYVTNGTLEYTAEDEVSTTDGAFTVAADEEQSKTIIATDKAGNQTVVTVKFVSLQKLQDQAKEEVDKKAEQAKDAIDQLEDLTDEEKAEAKAEIDKKAEDAKKQIEQSADREQVTDQQETGQSDVAAAQKEAEKKDLDNAKDKAKDELTKQAEEAKAMIDSLPNLTEKEKADAKAEIDEKLKKAQDAIDQAGQKTEIGDTKFDSQTDIADKLDKTKKQDKDKGTQTKPSVKPTPTVRPTATPKTRKDQSKLSGNEIDKLKLPLLLAKGKGGNKKISLSWTKIKNATGYECYWSYCDGKKNFRKFKAVKNGKPKAVHKKLKNTRKYKYFVVAYKMVDGDKIYIAKSPQLHVAMKADKKTNAKRLHVNAKKVNLKVGKTFRIQSAIKLGNAKKKQVLHAKEFRYYTSNAKVAKVTAKGKIKAVANGKCTIYVIANNGLCKKIKVTVARKVKVTKSKSLVLVGTTFVDKKTKATYRITSLKKKTVEYVGTTDKQAQEILVAAKVKYKGKTYTVTKVADKAFVGNKKLTRIDLSKTVNKVGKQAFQNCTNLKKVVVYSDQWNTKTIGTKAFQGIASKAHVYCEESVWEKYEGYFASAGAPADTIINFLSIL